jgi:hypothetical protein
MPQRSGPILEALGTNLVSEVSVAARCQCIRAFDQTCWMSKLPIRPVRSVRGFGPPEENAAR